MQPAYVEQTRMFFGRAMISIAQVHVVPFPNVEPVGFLLWIGGAYNGNTSSGFFSRRNRVASFKPYRIESI